MHVARHSPCYRTVLSMQSRCADDHSDPQKGLLPSMPSSPSSGLSAPSQPTGATETATDSGVRFNGDSAKGVMGATSIVAGLMRVRTMQAAWRPQAQEPGCPQSTERLERIGNGEISRPPRKLPALRRHSHFFTFFYEKRNPDLKPRLQRGGRGHAAARRIAAHTRFCRGNCEFNERR